MIGCPFKLITIILDGSVRGQARNCGGGGGGGGVVLDYKKEVVT